MIDSLMVKARGENRQHALTDLADLCCGLRKYQRNGIWANASAEGMKVSRLGVLRSPAVARRRPRQPADFGICQTHPQL